MVEFEIPLIDANKLKERSGCGKTKHEKYGAYMDAIRNKPDIIEYFITNIEKNPKQYILVRVVDVAKSLGPYFEKITEDSVHWAMKYVLFQYGIFATRATDRDINPKTQKNYLLLKLRMVTVDDKLPDSLQAALEPEDLPEHDPNLRKCAE